eukprot:406398_1
MGNNGLTAKHRSPSRSQKQCKVALKDEFIIELNRHFQLTSPRLSNADSMDQRRVVFVSLYGLFQTYLKCPPHILYSALLVLPIKKEWIGTTQSIPHSNPLTSLSLFNSGEETERFVHLLQWKYAQGLLLCMLDDYPESETSLIQPFWRHLSDTLGTLYDTVTGLKYNALRLDDHWWETHFSTQKHRTKYGTTTPQILNELYFLTMNYKSMQEIIFQSNPSLNPITFYGQRTDYFKPMP